MRNVSYCFIQMEFADTHLIRFKRYNFLSTQVQSVSCFHRYTYSYCSLKNLLFRKLEMYQDSDIGHC